MVIIVSVRIAMSNSWIIFVGDMAMEFLSPSMFHNSAFKLVLCCVLFCCLFLLFFWYGLPPYELRPFWFSCGTKSPASDYNISRPEVGFVCLFKLIKGEHDSKRFIGSFGQ